MRAVVQRVLEASVTTGGVESARIGRGALVLLGVHSADTEEDARYLAEKTVYLRIFPDRFGKMNQSVLDIEGEVLIVNPSTMEIADVITQ